MKDIIEKAYSNVEDISMFDRKTFEAYKIKRLKYQLSAVEFLKNIRGNNIKLLDIGSGSSALAYALSNNDILSYADCIEPSESRYLFAEKWKNNNTEYSNVSNHNVDIQKFSGKYGYYNTITIIDNTFSYIGLYYKESKIDHVLKKLYNYLCAQGCLIIEVSLFRNYINQINVSTTRIVQEYEISGDEIGLWEYGLVSDNIINIKSKYINSNFELKTKEENSRIYSELELVNKMKKIGFKEIVTYENFQQDSYTVDISDKLLLIANK